MTWWIGPFGLGASWFPKRKAEALTHPVGPQYALILTLKLRVARVRVRYFRRNSEQNRSFFVVKNAS